MKGFESFIPNTGMIDLSREVKTPWTRTTPWTPQSKPTPLTPQSKRSA